MKSWIALRIKTHFAGHAIRHCKQLPINGDYICYATLHVMVQEGLMARDSIVVYIMHGEIRRLAIIAWRSWDEMCASKSAETYGWVFKKAFKFLSPIGREMCKVVVLKAKYATPCLLKTIVVCLGDGT